MSASEPTEGAPAGENAEPKTVIQFTFENPLSLQMSFSIKNVTPNQLHLVRSWVDLNFPHLIEQIEAQSRQSPIAVPGRPVPPSFLRGKG